MQFYPKKESQRIAMIDENGLYWWWGKRGRGLPDVGE